MHSPRLLLAGVLLVSAGSGCIFYSDDDDDCLYGTGEGGQGAEADPAYDPGIRNPETGQCEYWGGGGGGGGCNDPCNPCPDVPTDEDRAPAPTWGFCESQCTGLDESTCTATGGCRAIYVSSCIDDDCIDEPLFADCWSTDMTGPIQGGGCEGLDSYTCSMHDDCSAVHHQVCDEGGFQEAPAACAGAFGYCTSEGDPVDPGNCYEPVTCDQTAPECPDGTTPGIRNGCYTGYCIPLANCEAQPACGEIPAEASCIARTDCTPIYRGENCSCEDTVCTCESWVYEECQ